MLNSKLSENDQPTVETHHAYRPARETNTLVQLLSTTSANHNRWTPAEQSYKCLQSADRLGWDDAGWQ